MKVSELIDFHVTLAINRIWRLSDPFSPRDSLISSLFCFKMFRDPCDLQNQSSNLLYKTHKTLPDLAFFYFSIPSPHQFCSSNTQIPCNRCSRSNRSSSLCLCSSFSLPMMFSPTSFSWLTQFKYFLFQEAFQTAPCPTKPFLQALRGPGAWLAIFTCHAA